MFYISSQPEINIFGVTDTTDGVEEFYTRRDILQISQQIEIKGINALGEIRVINATKDIAQKSFNKFGDVVKRKIYSYDYETCENLARRGGFVRKLKELAGSPDMYHKLMYEMLYPDSIKSVVNSAAKYSNSIREVDCSNPEAIKQALRTEVCLVLQHGSKGALTAFICTGSLGVVDSIYGVGFFDGVYLTKCLTDMTYDVSKVYARKESDKPKNPDLLQVFSCSLRLREERIKADEPLKEISSPFYSVNIPNVLGMYVLDNPAALGDLILPEFNKAKDKSKYKFDFDLYNEVRVCLEDASNYFGNEQKMSSICKGTFRDGVTVRDLCERFTGNFDYMEYLRGFGYSFK